MDMQSGWTGFAERISEQLPHLLGALAIFIVGWIAALLVRAAARRSLGFL